MKKIFFLLTIFTAMFLSAAQFKVVSDVKELAGDITAQKYGQKDVNGQWCAIVKVHSDIEGILFEGMGYEKHDYKGNGIYLVYMQPESKTLKFMKEDFVAYNHTFPNKLKANIVYQMEVVSEGEEKKIEDIAVNLIGQPEGVSIYVDSLEKGVVKQFMTSVGNHDVVVSKEGYQSEKLEIEVSPENTMFNYKLEKLRDAVFEVTSEPTGATVYLNGVKIGVTPITELYPIGNYKVRIEAENYEIFEDSLEIRLPDTRKNFKLDFIGATLTINTHEKAKVSINGTEISNLKNIKLTPQIINIKVELKSAQTISKKIILGKKDNQTVDMYPDVKTGTVQITVKPDDASVEMYDDSGIIYKSLGSKIFTDIPVGSYELKTGKVGYKTQKSEIKVSENAVEKKNFILDEGNDDPNKKDPWGSGMWASLEVGYPTINSVKNYKDSIALKLDALASIGYVAKYDFKLNKRIDLIIDIRTILLLTGPEPTDSTAMYISKFGWAIANGGLKVKMPAGFYTFGEAGISRVFYKFEYPGQTEGEQYDSWDFNYSLGLGYEYKLLDISAYFNSIYTDYEIFPSISLQIGYKLWVF